MNGMLPTDGPPLASNDARGRPAGHGWVRYHQAGPLSNVPWLAMTWRGGDGGLRWAAALGRQREGRVAATGRLRDFEGVGEAVEAALRSGPQNSTPDCAILAAMLPGGGRAEQGFFTGLPPDAERATMAGRAVAAAYLPGPMRAAFEAILRHGAPRDVELMELCEARRRTFKPLWAAMAVAAARPGLARLVLAAERELMTEPDPMAAVRRRFPGLTDAHLARLDGPEAPPRTGARPGRETAAACLALLADCPVDWFPRAGQWPPFAASALAIDGIRRGWKGAPSPRELAGPSGGDWDGYMARLLRAAGAPPVGNVGGILSGAGGDCIDPIRALARTVLIPLAALGADDDALAGLESSPDLFAGSVEAAGRILYEGKSAAGILEASRLWHAKWPAIEAEIRGVAGAASWPPLFEGAFRDRDVDVACIADYETLREEGAPGPDRDGIAGMSHCVATRLPECLSGRSHVLSVRRRLPGGSFERLSTCEVSLWPDDGGPRIRIVQHRGRENAEPRGIAHDAVERLAAAVASGEMPINPAVLAARPSRRGELAEICAYDFRDPAAVAAAVAAWRPLLPRWARDLGPEDLRQVLGDRGLMPAGLPDTPTAPRR